MVGFIEQGREGRFGYTGISAFSYFSNEN